MKQLLQMDSTKVIQHYLDTKTVKLLKPYDRSKKSFIPHLIALFATIPLVYNDNWKKGTVSMAKTLAAIPDRHITSEGEFSRQQIMNYIRIAATFPRGKLISGTQIAEPKYAGLTPLFMYAHKKFNDVPYSAWDWEDSRINAALGPFLAEANDFRKRWPNWEFGADHDIPGIRDSLAKEKKFTEWNNFATRSVSIDVEVTDGEWEKERVKLPKEICLMQYQFWIANAQLRDTDSMLLDIYNYGAVPKALDCIADIKAKLDEEWK